MNNEKKYTYGEMENLVHLTADLYARFFRVKESIGHRCERFDTTQERAAFFIEKAVELEKRLGGVDENEGDYDYFEELEKFENEIIEEIESYQTIGED